MNAPETVGVPLMVTVLVAQEPVTPAGNPVMVVPVAPVVAYVILVMAVLIHLVCVLVPAADVNVMVLLGVTVMVPVVLIVPHPPFRATV